MDPLTSFRSFDEFKREVTASNGIAFKDQLEILESKYDPNVVNIFIGFHHAVGTSQAPAWLAHDLAHILKADDTLVRRKNGIEYGKYFNVKTDSPNPLPKTFDLADLAIPCLDPIVHKTFTEYESKENPGAGFGITMEPGLLADFSDDGIQNLMPYFLKTLKPLPPIRKISLSGQLGRQNVTLTPNENWPEFAKLANDLMAEVSEKFLDAINREMADLSDSIPHQRGAIVWF